MCVYILRLNNYNLLDIVLTFLLINVCVCPAERFTEARILVGDDITDMQECARQNSPVGAGEVATFDCTR